jgi:D-glycero-alpha-D-manno-heptose 1-phosphate guanylyltransferase
MTDVIILAGGKGTRLQSLIPDKPKCMATIGGRPFIYWLLTTLSVQEISYIVLALGYKSDQVIDYCNRYNNIEFSFNFDYNIEDELLGTGGAISENLWRIASSQVLVLNGDSFCRFNVHKLLEEHIKNKAKVTIQLTELADTSEYGKVLLNGNNKINQFAEKTGEHEAGLVNAGIYLMDTSIIEEIPENEIISLEKDIFPKLAVEGSLYAVTSKDPLYDIGTPERYELANKFFLQFGRSRLNFKEYVKGIIN